MHSLVQYMMVKAMVRDRNAERVDYNMMIISLLNINCEYLDVFSHQTITCCSLLDNNDVFDLYFFMWQESWTAEWGRASHVNSQLLSVHSCNLQCHICLMTRFLVQCDKSLCCWIFCLIFHPQNWCKKVCQNLIKSFYKKIIAMLCNSCKLRPHKKFWI